jgi:hypothetical protein
MPAGVAGGATAQTPQGEPAVESTVVGLSTALRISTMDKKQLAALASAWGVTVPVRAKKLELVERLLSHASEPRGSQCAASAAPSPPLPSPRESPPADEAQDASKQSPGPDEVRARRPLARACASALARACACAAPRCAACALADQASICARR